MPEDVFLLFLSFLQLFFTHTASLIPFSFLKAGTAVSPLFWQFTSVPLVSQDCPCTWTPRSGISTPKMSTHFTAKGRGMDALDLDFNSMSFIVDRRLFFPFLLRKVVYTVRLVQQPKESRQHTHPQVQQEQQQGCLHLFAPTNT